MLVGICGYMRTGKDSVAKLLTEYGYTHTAFANALREMAWNINPTIALNGAPAAIHQALTGDPFNHLACTTYRMLIEEVGYERAKEVPDFRRFLERLGTQGVRETFGYDAWIDLAMDRALEGHFPKTQNVVFSDVRFPNEVEAIRKYGGKLWRTHRPHFGPGGTHESATQVDSFEPDVTLTASSLEQLGELVQDALGAERDPDIIERWADAIRKDAVNV